MRLEENPPLDIVRSIRKNVNKKTRELLVLEFFSFMPFFHSFITLINFH